MASNPIVSLAQDSSPKLEIETPKEGQTLYGNKVPTLLSVTNFQLSPEESTDNKGHILLWLDQKDQTSQNAIQTNEETYIFSDVPYGTHTLTAELVTADKKSLTPPQKVSVNFTSAQLASDQKNTNTFDKKTAVVILAVVALVILAAWWYTKDEDDEIDQNDSKKPKKKATKPTKKKAKTKK